MKKKQIELLFKVLRDTDLSLKDARVRDEALRTITPTLEAFYADRKKIWDKYCDKNEDETPKETSDGQLTFATAILPQLTKDLEEFVNEDVLLTFKDVEKIKKFAENTNYKFGFGEVEVFDEIIKSIK